jgi:anti-sigma factor RsiW
LVEGVVIVTGWQCHRLAAALVDYVEGMLDDSRRLGVERHLATCADCAAAVSALREVPQALRAWPEPIHDDAVLLAQRASIRAAIDAAPPPRAGRGRGWLGDGWTWPGWRLPAAAFAGLLLIMILYRFVVTREPNGVAVARLDDATLVEVQNVTHALSPHGEWFPCLVHEPFVLPSAADGATGDGSKATADNLADEDLLRVSDLLDQVS